MECCICYSDISSNGRLLACDVYRSCNCRIHVCDACWIDQCKLLCPICQRLELNTPHQCNICGDSFHVKEIDYCAVCNLHATCISCSENSNNKSLHFCPALDQELPCIQSNDLVEISRCGDVGTGFAALGRVDIDPGLYVMVIRNASSEGGGYTLLIHGNPTTVPPDLDVVYLDDVRTIRYACVETIQRAVKVIDNLRTPPVATVETVYP
jgi:hypothetical protein